MKKTISLLLIAVMLCGMLAGCGSKEADALVGTWKADVDMAEALGEYVGDLGELEQYFTMDDFTVSMILVFNDDATYSMTLDRNSAEIAINGLIEDMKGAVYAMLEDQIAQMGLEMTVEEMLEASGMDLDALMEQSMAELDMESLIDQMVEEASLKGNYDAKDGKLYLSAGLEYKVDTSTYENYTLDGSTLTLTSAVGVLTDSFEGLYPVAFEKVA